MKTNPGLGAGPEYACKILPRRDFPTPSWAQSLTAALPGCGGHFLLSYAVRRCGLPAVRKYPAPTAPQR